MIKNRWAEFIDDSIEWVIDNLFSPLILMFLLAVVAAALIIPATILMSSKNDTFELKLDEWKCTDGFEKRYMRCSKGCYEAKEYVCTKYERKE